MKKVLIILATIAGVIALGNVLIVGAQNGSTLNVRRGPAMMGNYSTGNYTGTVPFRGALGAGPQGALNQPIVDAVAQKLGMTSADLMTALQSGQTIDQIAQSKGVSIDDLNKVALAAFKSGLADQVKQGTLTQQQADALLNRMGTPLLNFGRGFAQGKRGNSGDHMTGLNVMGGMQQPVFTAIAQKLGLTEADLITALQSGQTISQLAQSKGVSLDDLRTAATDAMKIQLDSLVKQGTLTQQQEDLMLAHMQDMQILGFGLGGGPRGRMPFGMPNGGGPNGFMPGNGMHHFGFPGGAQPQPQQPSTTPSTQG
jgi:cytidylate kinase